MPNSSRIAAKAAARRMPPESPCYDEVVRIIKFLHYIRDAAVEEELPPTSILREFVGGNTFYRKEKESEA